MASLRRELRKELEHAVTAARSAAEIGARKAIEALAVQNGKQWPSMTEDQKQLRNRLRAHGRQLGDRRELKSGNQSIDHIVRECAYEHWHRMLFARFLAENDLLIEPESGVAISLDECRELALERGVDWLTLASEFAVKMLSQIFRAGDPVLEIFLPPESRQELEGLMKSLPREVFLADDSLGWVYQFWQAEKKNEVNASGEKIGADELAPVTQLFTEDYMVLFLLHNTLGAWWAGKVLSQRPDLATSAQSEDELRTACAIGDVSWEYLRFVREGEGPWRPAAGTFDGWPKDAKNLKVLDPCMGSGHFLVFALPMLVALLMAEEKLLREDAIDAVLRDNLFGLELDNRCTQIAAFNLALGAWRMVGHRSLPPLNLACSGLGINAKQEEWVELAGTDERLRDGMAELFELFKKGPVLGSLINPGALNKTAPLLTAEFHDLQPLLQAALRREGDQNYEAAEMAIAAQGMAKAAEILADQFILVATNVPYLKRGKQSNSLTEFADEACPSAKADLATMFMMRCEMFLMRNATCALVTPHTWQFLGAYKKFRERFLRENGVQILSQLGFGAFETVSGEVVNVCLISFTTSKVSDRWAFAVLDVSGFSTPSEKARALVNNEITHLAQLRQLANPDARVVFSELGNHALLSSFSTALAGFFAGDTLRFDRYFWEVALLGKNWEFCQSTVEESQAFGGRSSIVFWEDERGQMYELAQSVRHLNHAAQNWLRGKPNWGKLGVAVSQMGQLPCTIYLGDRYDTNCCAIVPNDVSVLPALWAYCSSPEFAREVRRVDRSIKVTPHTLLKIPFDLPFWQKVAAENYPQGLPKPFSSDATQWLFSGHPNGSDQPLQVGVARLLGYGWPRQTGSSFPDCRALDVDNLQKFADVDGIVCLDALQGELSAAERLRALLAAAYGSEWSAAKLAELLAQVEAASLEQWLREEFFEQHCALFYNRPFIWHIWDGMKNGFHALVNYHKLAAPNGEGRRTLEKLIYSYLGDWIKQQRDDQKNGFDGADGRVAAAEYLKKQLELILHGEPPYDIFVRWKSLPQQPIGWEPDINDGVRLNIRPFIKATPLNARGRNASVLRVTPKNIEKDKDRGKEPYREKQDFPWFWTWNQSGTVDFTGGQKFDGNRWNDLHYSTSFKLAARDRNSLNKKKVKP